MAKDDRKRMGRQIAALRQARSWSQGQLADAAGVHLRTVQRAEAGRCRPETLLNLAAALDADVRDLVPPARPAPAFEEGAPEMFARTAALGGGRTLLARIETGKELLDLIARAVSWVFDHENVVGEDAEAVAALFQAVQGFGSIFSELQPGERVRAAATLHERLLAVEQQGLIVVGGVENRPLLVRPGHPVPRPVAVVAVSRPEEARSGRARQRSREELR